MTYTVNLQLSSYVAKQAARGEFALRALSHALDAPALARVRGAAMSDPSLARSIISSSTAEPLLRGRAQDLLGTRDQLARGIRGLRTHARSDSGFPWKSASTVPATMPHSSVPALQPAPVTPPAQMPAPPTARPASASVLSNWNDSLAKNPVDAVKSNPMGAPGGMQAMAAGSQPTAKFLDTFKQWAGKEQGKAPVL